MYHVPVLLVSLIAVDSRWEVGMGAFEGFLEMGRNLECTRREVVREECDRKYYKELDDEAHMPDRKSTRLNSSHRR